MKKFLSALGFSSFVAIHILLGLFSLFESMGIAAFCNYYWDWNVKLIFVLSMLALNLFQSVLVYILGFIACWIDLFVFWDQGGWQFWCPAIFVGGIVLFVVGNILLSQLLEEGIKKTHQKKAPTTSQNRKQIQVQARQALSRLEGVVSNERHNWSFRLVFIKDFETHFNSFNSLRLYNSKLDTEIFEIFIPNNKAPLEVAFASAVHLVRTTYLKGKKFTKIANVFSPNGLCDLVTKNTFGRKIHITKKNISVVFCETEKNIWVVSFFHATTPITFIIIERKKGGMGTTLITRLMETFTSIK